MKGHNQMCDPHRLQYRDGNRPMNMIAGIILSMWLVGIDMKVCEVAVSLTGTEGFGDVE